MTRTCPKCGEERPARGFDWHEKYCKGTLNIPTEKVLYPKQKNILSPDEYAKFLRKAEARI